MDLQKENINLYVASIFHMLYQIIFLIIVFNLCNVWEVLKQELYEILSLFTNPFFYYLIKELL